MEVWVLHLHMTKGQKQEQGSSVMQPWEWGQRAEQPTAVHGCVSAVTAQQPGKPFPSIQKSGHALSLLGRVLRFLQKATIMNLFWLHVNSNFSFP